MPEVVPSGSRSLTGYTALVGKVVLVGNVRQDRRFDLAPGSMPTMLSAIAAPVVRDRNVVAVLVAGSDVEAAFVDSAAPVIQGMANIVGVTMRLGAA